jgi:hypothetical protein
MLLATEIQRFGGVVGRHQVPPRSPAGQVIQRGEFARDVIRLVVAGGGRGDQADMFGHHTQRRQQGQRLEVVRTRHAAGDVTAGRRHAVGEKHRVKPGRLGDLRQVFVVGEIQPGIGRYVGVTPGRDVVPGGHQKSAEFELTSHGQKSLRSCTPK